MWRLGEVLRITRGPYRDFSGHLKRVHPDGRLEVSIVLFGESSVVMVGLSKVEKV